MNANAAFELQDFIVPLLLGTFAVGFTIGYAIYSFVRLVRSGESLLVS